MEADWSQCQLIYSGLSELYRDQRNPLVCYKKISKTSLPPPHNSQKELYFLKKLNKDGEKKNEHIVQLLNYVDDEVTDTVDPFYVFEFRYYQVSFDEYLLQFWKLKGELAAGSTSEISAKTRRKKFTFSADGTMQLQAPVTSKSNTHPVFINKMTEKTALDLFKQIVDGLDFIHANKIIHRDIKPQNIMVDESGVLKIIDFDISYDVEHNNGSTESDFTKKITDVSTSIYKAPELLFGVGNYDYGIDIWSLMIVLQHFALREYAPALDSQHSVQNIEKLSRWKLPCKIDNGMEINYTKDYVIHGGSDIRLITSIFETFRIPSLEKWPTVSKYGSDTFEYMFASEGDPSYLEKVDFNSLFPLFSPDLVRECIAPMCIIEQTERITSAELKKRLKLHE
ncbi:hypothetical protein ACO0QE_003057 [Hanseniaspora vineae]